MPSERSHSTPKRSGIEKEEERAWVSFYRRARRDAGVANEVLTQLEADPDSKRAHLALYLCCRNTLRRHRARQQRNRRAAQGIKRFLPSVVEIVACWCQSIGSDIRDVAAAWASDNRRSVPTPSPGRPLAEHRPAMSGAHADEDMGQVNQVSRAA
jgi:hypothetical protein